MPRLQWFGKGVYSMTPFKVGVCVILRHGTHVLMGLRKGSHGAGTWSFPGGHVDGNESPEESAFRELKEETGLYLTGQLQKLGFVLTEFSPEKRYITLYFGLDVPSRLEAKVMEPEKCGGWQWFDANQLPTPLFEAVENMLEQQNKLIPLGLATHPVEPNVPRRFEPTGPNAPNWRACPMCKGFRNQYRCTCDGSGLVPT